MKCNNNKCSIDVPSSFEFAIMSNKCPKCGFKLLPELAMKTFLDLKARLKEVELVMDPAVNYERIAMFIISNYEVIPASKATMSNRGSEENEISILTGEGGDLADDEELDRDKIAKEVENERLAADWGLNTGGGTVLDEATRRRVEKMKLQKARVLGNAGVFSVKRSEEE